MCTTFTHGPAHATVPEARAGSRAAASTAATDGGPGDRHSVRVRLDGGARTAVEAGLPRTGAYGRAIRMDAQGRHIEALRLYAEALVELKGLGTSLAASPDQVLAWRAKIVWQREESEELIEQEAYASVMPTSVTAHFSLAQACHAKFLSVRAFLGRGPTLLWERARAEYETVLELDSRHPGARLGLARLSADIGQLDQARRDFALLGRRRDADSLALQVAAFHVAVGDREAALAYLARAMTKPENRRFARTANDFDLLRPDPRFQALVGAPWKLAARPDSQVPETR